MSDFYWTRLDYTHPLARHGQPWVTQGHTHVPVYTARRSDDGADVMLDGGKVASFPSMAEAVQFVNEQCEAAWRKAGWRPVGNPQASGASQ